MLCYFCNLPVHRPRSQGGKGKGGAGRGKGGRGRAHDDDVKAPEGYCLGPGRCQFREFHIQLTSLLNKKNGNLDEDFSEMLRTGRSFKEQLQRQERASRSYHVYTRSRGGTRRRRDRSMSSVSDEDSDAGSSDTERSQRTDTRSRDGSRRSKGGGKKPTH